MFPLATARFSKLVILFSSPATEINEVLNEVIKINNQLGHHAVE